MRALRESRRVKRERERLQYIDDALKCVCKSCNEPFKQITHLGSKAAYCKSCAEQLEAESNRKSRRVAKSRRRARIRNTKSDPIDPFDVFETADWACYLCGVNTPKSLRGTYDSRAPELDHIIPLSKGGTHTMDNVACACRKCNNIKGDILPNTPRRGNSSAGGP
ncbi:HNH endonuclease [Psychrobacter arenosus]